MHSILKTLLSLAAAGTMMISVPLDEAAPQHDMDGPVFLANRQWKVSRYYIPENMRQAQVQGLSPPLDDKASSAVPG